MRAHQEVRGHAWTVATRAPRRSALAMLVIFPWAAAFGIAVAHLLIDTRRPLEWWSRISTQPQTGPLTMTIHTWRDQTLHVLTLAVVALIVA